MEWEIRVMEHENRFRELSDSIKHHNSYRVPEEERGKRAEN